MSTIIVCLIISAFLSFPYILAALRLKKMLSKLRRIAKKQAFNIIDLRPLPWLPKNFGGKYDVIIEGRGITVAVKLLTPIRKNTTLVITPAGEAGILSKARAPMDIEPVRGKRRDIDIRSKMKNISELRENWNPVEWKEIDKAFLVYPPFERIIFDDGREKAELRTGDKIFGKTICSPYFIEQKMRISGQALPQSEKYEFFE